MNTVKVSKESEFFIAICQLKKHSYVTCGVKEPGKDSVLLASFGKTSYDFCLPTMIVNESAVKYSYGKDYYYEPKKHLIRYKAYAISLDQYRAFLEYLKTLSQKQIARNEVIPPLKAYQFKAQDEETITLEWSEFADPEKKHKVAKRFYQFGLFNTCRHSAKEFVKEANQVQDFEDGVSSFSFIKPPLAAIFDKGVVTAERKFYILPLPPTAFKEIDSQKKMFLTALYKRMETICLLNSESDKTFEKFSKLKALYQRIAPKESGSILHVIQTIKDWERENLSLIQTHRKTHWFTFKTATENMFASFHKQFDKIEKRTQPVENNYARQ
ncbi:MAG: hypothetical protein WC785_10675 [Tatlockia sp.]|jgi:hypothetical protein